MNFFRRSTTNGYENMDIVNYRSDYYEGNTEHVLVDVRTSSEYRNSHLPGAINIPLDQLRNRHAELDSNKPVIVVCASGNRSRTGAKILINAGFENVYNLKGGTMSWMMAGLPTE